MTTKDIISGLLSLIVVAYIVRPWVLKWLRRGR
jgi:hypothetical protein